MYKYKICTLSPRCRVYVGFVHCRPWIYLMVVLLFNVIVDVMQNWFRGSCA